MRLIYGNAAVVPRTDLKFLCADILEYYRKVCIYLSESPDDVMGVIYGYTGIRGQAMSYRRAVVPYGLI